MPVRVLPAIFLLIASTAALAQSPPAARPVPDWAKERMGRWYEAFNAGDVTDIMTLYASDATLLVADRTYVGSEFIEGFHRRNFAGARFTCTWTVVDAFVANRLGAVWGTDSCVETPTSGGAASRWTGRWLTVFQRQPDGSWLIVRDGGEEDRPAR